jgi:hypothetical protein
MAKAPRLSGKRRLTARATVPSASAAYLRLRTSAPMLRAGSFESGLMFVADESRDHSKQMGAGAPGLNQTVMPMASALVS